MTVSRAIGGEKGATASFETAIRARGLRKTRGGVVAVDGVDLEVRRGEVFGLLGPDGAGKSTVLEIIEGCEKPDAGEIEVMGRDATRELKATTGVREAALFGHLTLHETLALFADLHDADFSPTRIRGLLEAASLTEEAGRMVRGLSDGEKQRFYLALALVNDPETILLDEPTAGLDRTARRKAWEMVRRIRAMGTTVVMTTGSVEEAKELCDRVALMERGKIIARGTPWALLKPLSLDATVGTTIDDKQLTFRTGSF